MNRRRFQFRELALRLAPPWLQSGAGAKVLYSFTAPLDAIMDWAWAGIAARMPLEAVPDALGAIGRDRQIVRGPAESDDAYRVRLAQHLAAWRYAGHARSIAGAVRGYFAPDPPRMRIITNAGVWYTLESDSSFAWEKQLGAWDWDSHPERWWRFWLVIYSEDGTPWEPEDTWGTGTWGDGGTWGTTATPAEVASVRALVKQWKPSHATCVNIVVAFDDASFAPGSPEPDGLWGPWGKSDPRVPSRLDTARYCDGVS